MRNPLLSVVILMHQEEANIGICLDSLEVSGSW
jgi:hypothetical protein